MRRQPTVLAWVLLGMLTSSCGPGDSSESRAETQPGAEVADEAPGAEVAGAEVTEEVTGAEAAASAEGAPSAAPAAGEGEYLAETDHLVYAVPDLEAAVDELEQTLGVRAIPGGRHKRWGTANALLALGPRTYLEILGPDPARPDPAMPTLLGIDQLAAPRLAGWAVGEQDLEGRRAWAARGSLELGEISEGSREKPDGSLLTWRLTAPDAGAFDGLVPFMIDWRDSEHPAIGSPKGCTLVRLRGEHPEPASLRLMLGAMLVDMPVTEAPAPALIATLDCPKGRVELR